MAFASAWVLELLMRICCFVFTLTIDISRRKRRVFLQMLTKNKQTQPAVTMSFC